MTHEALDCPAVLFGPLYNTLQPGRYLYHPHFRSFRYGAAGRGANLSASHMRAAMPAGQLRDLIPSDFEPELLIWSSLALLALPEGLEQAPCPTLAIAHDWHLNTQACLENAARFDFVVGDRAFVELLRKQGHTHCAPWIGYSFQPGNHQLWPGMEREWDLSFIGDLSYLHHPRRTQDLARLRRLSPPYRILIGSHYYGQDYVRILNQSKIVFNRSVRGELNMRSFEAAACGALLLLERDNLEVHTLFQDGVSCVLYGDDDLEDKIIHYLQHAESRQRIAAEGMRLVHTQHSPEQRFRELLAFLPQAHERFARRQRRRPRPAPLSLARQQFFSHSGGAVTQSIQHSHRQQGATRFGLALELNLQLQRMGQQLPGQPAPASARQGLLQRAQALLQHSPSRWGLYYWAYAALLNGQLAGALQAWQSLYSDLQQKPLTDAEVRDFVPVPGGAGPEISLFRRVWEGDLAAYYLGHKDLGHLTRRLQAQILEALGQLWAQEALRSMQSPQSSLNRAGVQALQDRAVQALRLSLAGLPHNYPCWQSLLLLQRLRLQHSPTATHIRAYLEDLQRAAGELSWLEALQRERLQAWSFWRDKTKNPPTAHELREAANDYRSLIQQQLVQGAGDSVLFQSLGVSLEDWARSLIELEQRA